MSLSMSFKIFTRSTRAIMKDPLLIIIIFLIKNRELSFLISVGKVFHILAGMFVCNAHNRFCD